MMPQDLTDSAPLLTENFYSHIQGRILGQGADGGDRDKKDTGACVLYESEQSLLPLTPAHDTSLRRQLHQIVTWPGALHSVLDNHPPDSFVFIRPAGVALRHTLDGFYDKLYGGIVRRHGPKRPPIALLPAETFRHEQGYKEVEADRLRAKLNGQISHVCLIDNDARYYDSYDIQLAASVAYAAGALAVTALRTKLFENVDPRLIDVNKLQVPAHAKFMSKLGKLCCNLDYNPTED
jgi:hypothetical protein